MTAITVQLDDETAQQLQHEAQTKSVGLETLVADLLQTHVQSLTMSNVVSPETKQMIEEIIEEDHEVLRRLAM